MDNQESDPRKQQTEDCRKRCEELDAIIKEAKTELETLQESCDHKSTAIKNVNPSGSSSMKKVCEICKKDVGHPTTQEIEDWRKG